MLVLYASLSVLASVMTALAPVPGLFIFGHVLQGLTTSLMLIAAVRPLVIGWPTSKMPWTAVTMNLCVFGAVALGPVLGGLQAATGGWRLLFWVVAGLAGAALLFAVLTFEDRRGWNDHRAGRRRIPEQASADAGSPGCRSSGRRFCPPPCSERCSARGSCRSSHSRAR